MCSTSCLHFLPTVLQAIVPEPEGAMAGDFAWCLFALKPEGRNGWFCSHLPSTDARAPFVDGWVAITGRLVRSAGLLPEAIASVR